MSVRNICCILKKYNFLDNKNMLMLLDLITFTKKENIYLCCIRLQLVSSLQI